MILDNIISFFFNILSGIIDILPQVPVFPSNLSNTISSILDFLFSYINIINFFIPVQICTTLLLGVLFIQVLKRMWSALDFLLRHIPLFGTH